ncbi:unnamed protein product, partial [Rhizophagus irregularis]
NELIKEFEEITVAESNLIKDESIVALKHIATGKYLSSAENLYYTTGKFQLIFAGNPVPDPNSLWKIKFGKELASYNNTLIKLQHIKSNNKFLGIYTSNKSPSTNHTEVSCNNLNQVVCHNERLGGNDEWCIELIKQHIWTIDTLHD